MNEGTFTICLPTLNDVLVTFETARWWGRCIPDVTLTDEDTGVVDGLGKAKLVDAGLETTLQEVLDLEGKDVIELHAGLVKDTDTDQTANESIALEETLGVLLVKSEERTGACQKFASATSVRCQRDDGTGAKLTGQHDGSWRG